MYYVYNPGRDLDWLNKMKIRKFFFYCCAFAGCFKMSEKKSHFLSQKYHIISINL